MIERELYALHRALAANLMEPTTILLNPVDYTRVWHRLATDHYMDTSTMPDEFTICGLTVKPRPNFHITPADIQRRRL